MATKDSKSEETKPDSPKPSTSNCTPWSGGWNYFPNGNPVNPFLIQSSAARGRKHQLNVQRSENKSAKTDGSNPAVVLQSETASGSIGSSPSKQTDTLWKLKASNLKRGTGPVFSESYSVAKKLKFVALDEHATSEPENLMSSKKPLANRRGYTSLTDGSGSDVPLIGSSQVSSEGGIRSLSPQSPVALTETSSDITGCGWTGMSSLSGLPSLKNEKECIKTSPVSSSSAEHTNQVVNNEEFWESDPEVVEAVKEPPRMLNRNRISEAHSGGNEIVTPEVDSEEAKSTDLNIDEDEWEVQAGNSKRVFDIDEFWKSDPEMEDAIGESPQNLSTNTVSETRANLDDIGIGISAPEAVSEENVEALARKLVDLSIRAAEREVEEEIEEELAFRSETEAEPKVEEVDVQEPSSSIVKNVVFVNRDAEETELGGVGLDGMIAALKIRGDKTSSVPQPGPMGDIFYSACLHGLVPRVVRILFEGYVSVNDSLMHTWSGIQHACFNGQSDVVKVLLEVGADPNFCRTSDGLDVLMSAACSPLNEQEGVLDCLKLVVKSGGNVNSKQVNGFSPLIYTVRRGHEEMCKYLLENGADINQQDSELRTPINWAAYRNNIPMVKLLLEFGANPSIKNNKNQTSFKTAIHGKHSEIAKLLAYSQNSNWRLGLPVKNLDAPTGKKDKLMEYARIGIENEPSFDPKAELEKCKQEKSDMDCFLDKRVEAALVSLDLEKWCPVMAKRRINYTQFVNLKENGLINLGITRLAEINKIAGFISDLKKGPLDSRKPEERPVSAVEQIPAGKTCKLRIGLFDPDQIGMAESGTCGCENRNVSENASRGTFGKKPMMLKKKTDWEESKKLYTLSVFATLGILIAALAFRK